ncbi:hypothetical protein HDU93_001894 [Gonapodya sp. JEL0774]|nr:hypothetical protein HDU93_001894 [Gonapodya sp. JEL0774]
MLTGKPRGISPPPKRLPISVQPKPTTKTVPTTRVQLQHPSPLTLRTARLSDASPELGEDELSLSTSTMRASRTHTPLSRRSPSPATSKVPQSSSGLSLGGLESKTVYGDAALHQVHQTILNLRRENAELKGLLQGSQDTCGKLKAEVGGISRRSRENNGSPITIQLISQNSNLYQQLTDSRDSLRVKTALLQTLETRIKDLERELTRARSQKGSAAAPNDSKKTLHVDEMDSILSKSMSAAIPSKTRGSASNTTPLSTRAATLERVTSLASTLRPSSPDNRVRKPMLYTPPMVDVRKEKGRRTPTTSESGLTQLIEGSDSELNLDSSFRIEDPITEQEWELSSNRSSKLFRAFLNQTAGAGTILDETQSNQSTEMSDFEIPGVLYRSAPAMTNSYHREVDENVTTHPNSSAVDSSYVTQSRISRIVMGSGYGSSTVLNGVDSAAPLPPRHRASMGDFNIPEVKSRGAPDFRASISIGDRKV